MPEHEWFRRRGIPIDQNWRGGVIVFANGIKGVIQHAYNGSPKTYERAEIYYNAGDNVEIGQKYDIKCDASSVDCLAC